MNKSKSLKRYVGRGKRLFSQGKYEKALECFEKAKIKSPENAKIYNHIANVYFVINPEKAIAVYSKAIELKADFVNAYMARAILYACFMNNCQKEAEKDYNMALKYAPNNYKLYHYRGEFYSSCEKYDLSIKDFSCAIKLKPNKFMLYILRGRDYLQQKEYIKAMQDFLVALNTDILHEKMDAYLNLGKTYYLLADYEKALETYTRCLNDMKLQIVQDEKFAKIYKYRSEVYAKLGEKENAEADLKIVSEIKCKIENNDFVCF